MVKTEYAQMRSFMAKMENELAKKEKENKDRKEKKKK